MTNKNPLQCDPKTGFCEVSAGAQEQPHIKVQNNQELPMRIIYYTDPICSACWAIEGVLRKLKLEYGHVFVFDCHMGGLLPAFGKGYDPGDFYTSEDLAKLWDEASDHYRVPINGGIWLNDPLNSSFPPSIAYKAAQLQSQDKADDLLRHLREMLFVGQKNIAKEDVILKAAQETKLDIDQIQLDIKGKGKSDFMHDLELGKELKVRGFPTLFFFNLAGDHKILYGVHAYPDYENYILKLDPLAQKREYDKYPLALMRHFQTMTVKELSILAEYGYFEAEQDLEKLEKEGKITAYVTPKGKLWRINR
ncbi:DsbA family protein [Bacteroides coprosuis]|uniref:DsbA family protein n=1 Tax=Bacteroides coprosuis TaxID=151276 RepID=UPI001DB422DF|nr:DsbA family protein [Bacteroides coprosuis]HJD92929.1 DsbA family protein [Bacteroides coprosuis]